MLLTSKKGIVTKEKSVFINSFNLGFFSGRFPLDYPSCDLLSETKELYHGFFYQDYCLCWSSGSQDRQSCLDCLVVLEVSFWEEFPIPSLKMLSTGLEHNVWGLWRERMSCGVSLAKESYPSLEYCVMLRNTKACTYLSFYELQALNFSFN